MDAAVGDELGERDAGDLAPHGVEAGQDHRLRRVVDDEVDAGEVLERADVAALAPDDAALHVVGRQVDDRDGGLGDVLGGGALDAEGEDVAGPPVALSARLLLDLAHHLGHVVARVFLGLHEEHLLGLGGAESGDALELDHGLVVGALELVGKSLAVGVPVADGLLAPVLLRAARVDGLFALKHTLLGLAELLAAVAQLALDLGADTVHLFLGLEARLLDDGLRLAAGILQQLVGLALGSRKLAGGEIAADEIPHRQSDRQSGDDIHRSHHSLYPFAGRAARKRPGNAPGLRHARTCKRYRRLQL